MRTLSFPFLASRHDQNLAACAFVLNSLGPGAQEDADHVHGGASSYLATFGYIGVILFFFVGVLLGILLGYIQTTIGAQRTSFRV